MGEPHIYCVLIWQYIIELGIETVCMFMYVYALCMYIWMIQ